MQHPGTTVVCTGVLHFELFDDLFDFFFYLFQTWAVCDVEVSGERSGEIFFNRENQVFCYIQLDITPIKQFSNTSLPGYFFRPSRYFFVFFQ